MCVIARWAPGGHWEQVYVERGYLKNGPSNACLPRAVLDMDGDGVPEVVYYGTEREWWGYNVARLGAEALVVQQRDLRARAAMAFDAVATAGHDQQRIGTGPSPATRTTG